VDPIVCPTDGLVTILAVVAALDSDVLGGAELGARVADGAAHAGTISQRIGNKEYEIPRKKRPAWRASREPSFLRII
jgi:hypothetical protein